ncbi:hypothetical protein CcaverHIS002_0113660 [Cutaneotrichosporon cavernicola]|uniref:Uncharacterized protein n=1 Tax=Cutaneotrichosporon cavernicola TaxID=279322 RepID=A0AA48I7R3_9TREE|nr:uncharacterized protein CcaverHIS019_0113530 [Cutaneotrichosporon cavernicola]BEI80837.1 hypothetical protein CcaverHIS002_0113660 [Cutaneotrichosporon cavernicola]BEI88635.1 hypothetical protein CcaverHIS019_0113530 [Cutaneotrichosporon cavernicola]BEI96408.1 hypothetical protein CcaverHIS631_0113570 [Cutaneotrichosporon cavernicola]BEJ04180.1 hypothetical protein CcaverHIS641_0113550 [Cutaneotrichosporon cavernicola]
MYQGIYFGNDRTYRQALKALAQALAQRRRLGSPDVHTGYDAAMSRVLNESAGLMSPDIYTHLTMAGERTNLTDIELKSLQAETDGLFDMLDNLSSTEYLVIDVIGEDIHLQVRATMTMALCLLPRRPRASSCPPRRALG